jgi:hypothetical protein
MENEKLETKKLDWKTLLLIGATMFGAKIADAQVRAANLTLITPVENASEYVITRV